MNLSRLAFVSLLFVVAVHTEAEAGWAAEIRATYASVGGQLASSPFGRQLVLESKEAGNRVQGAAYAVLDHSFAQVRDGLRGPRQWCPVLILHLNVKDCRAAPGGDGLALFLGRKRPEPPQDAQRLDFAYQAVADAPDFMETDLRADRGPADGASGRRAGDGAVLVVANLARVAAVGVAIDSPKGVLPPGTYAARSLLGGPDGAVLRLGAVGGIAGCIPAGAIGAYGSLVLALERR